jgi:hypothetical protein
VTSGDDWALDRSLEPSLTVKRALRKACTRLGLRAESDAAPAGIRRNKPRDGLQ